MLRFSLITGTLGRTSELEKLLASLGRQEWFDFELIVVDQNTDDRLIPILRAWSADMVQGSSGSFLDHQVVHLRSYPGLSHARNVGLEVCRGQIVAFPDDDCWYPPDTLLNVDLWFQDHPDYQLLSLGARDENGLRTANRWHKDTCDLAPLNIFRASASFTFFVNRASAQLQLCFDEALGIGSGTSFGSAEDTDFLLSLMKQGARGRFHLPLHICHPRKEFGENVSQERSLAYGRGMGRVLGKYSLRWIWMGFVFFDYLRATMYLVRGQQVKAKSVFAHGRGVMMAYFSRHPVVPSA